MTLGIFTKDNKVDVKALSDVLAGILADNQAFKIQNMQLQGAIVGLQKDRDILIKILKIQKKYDVAAAEENRKLAKKREELQMQAQSKNTVPKVTKDHVGPTVKAQGSPISA